MENLFDKLHMTLDDVVEGEFLATALSKEESLAFGFREELLAEASEEELFALVEEEFLAEEGFPLTFISEDLDLINSGVYEAEVVFGKSRVEFYVSNPEQNVERTLLLAHTITDFVPFEDYTLELSVDRWSDIWTSELRGISDTRGLEGVSGAQYLIHRVHLAKGSGAGEPPARPSPPPTPPTSEPTPRTPTPEPAPTVPPPPTPEPTPTPDPVKGDDRAALVALYNATGGDKWERNDNWNTDAPLDTWYGVTTDRDGYVIKLSLPGKEGSRKRLTGEIPAELGSLTRLVELDLSGNFLSGKIPFQLNNLTGLETLNLRGNSLEGPIPIPPPEGEGTTLGSIDSLKALDLGRNELNGGISAELVKLRNLEELRLDGNELSGRLPVQWGAGLKVVDLSRNDFTGGIPAGLAELPNLEELRLDWNELSGILPVQWGGGLEVVDLSRNELYGEIPEALGTLANLETLALGHNNFRGCIPVSLRGKVTGAEQRSPHPPLPNCPTQGELDADRAALREFYKLTGGSAWDTGKTWKVNDGSAPVTDDWAGVTVDATGRVTELVLEDSGLNNNIAGIGGGFYSLEMLGNLTELTKLDLSGNSLGGELPYRLDSLVNLTYLDLSNNAFSGDINRTDLSEDQSGDEIEWKNLTKLKHLDLSENNNDCTLGRFGPCKSLSGSVPWALRWGATEFPDLTYIWTSPAMG